MDEKEFDLQEELPDGGPDPELETPEEIQAENEDEGVREVSLSFPENEAWPPQPENQESSMNVPPPPPNDPVETYGEAKEGIEQEEVKPEEPVRMYNGKPYNPSSKSFGGVVINGTELDGFFFYTVKHVTGITLNGKHFDAGSYWFDKDTFGGVANIDLPFQD